MDIVMNARIKTKYKYFCCDYGLPLDSVEIKIFKHIAGLFNLVFSDKQWLTPKEMDREFIWFSCDVTASEQAVHIRLEIFFLDDMNILAKKYIKTNLAPNSNKKAVSRIIQKYVYKLLVELMSINPSPWGILRGVRPTKLVHSFMQQGLNSNAIAKQLTDDYLLTPGKANLITDIAVYQQKFAIVSNNPRDISVYIGIPFCPSRCYYCSFPAFVVPTDKEKLMIFITAIEQDIAAVVQLIDSYQLRVNALYIGGGTPTSLPEPLFEKLLSMASRLVGPETREFTVEAGRPDTVTTTKISAMLKWGVSRTSVNPQSMQDRTLQRIGRRHTAADVRRVYQLFRQAGMPIINMDIIAGLPDETPADMLNTLEQLMSLRPDNLTVHTLAVKRGSMLKDQAQFTTLPGDTAVEKMLEYAGDAAAKMEMSPYYLYRQKNILANLENVGYAKLGAECLYNVYMIEESQPIIGIGAGATTKAVDIKSKKIASFYYPKDVDHYCCSLAANIVKRKTLLDKLWDGF